MQVAGARAVPCKETINPEGLQPTPRKSHLMFLGYISKQLNVHLPQSQLLEKILQNFSRAKQRIGTILGALALLQEGQFD